MDSACVSMDMLHRVFLVASVLVLDLAWNQKLPLLPVAIKNHRKESRVAVPLFFLRFILIRRAVLAAGPLACSRTFALDLTPLPCRYRFFTHGPYLGKFTGNMDVNTRNGFTLPALAYNNHVALNGPLLT